MAINATFITVHQLENLSSCKVNIFPIFSNHKRMRQHKSAKSVHFPFALYNSLSAQLINSSMDGKTHLPARSTSYKKFFTCFLMCPFFSLKASSMFDCHSFLPSPVVHIIAITFRKWLVDKKTTVKRGRFNVFLDYVVARPAGFEPATFWFVVKHSIQLS